MKSWAFLFFLFPALAQAAGGEFCLQTFNVYATAYSSNVRPRLSALADTLTNDPCDAVQFQEFWRESDFNFFRTEFARSSMNLVQADKLRPDSSMTGLVSAFQGKVERSYSELYRINNEDGLLDWFRKLGGVQKGFTALQAKIESGPSVLFLNTHTHPTSEAIRTAQMIQLVDFALLRAEKATELPVIFTADLNATPDSLEMALLEKVLLLRNAYLEANQSYGDSCTYCNTNPLSWLKESRTIDFTLIRSAPSLELRSRQSEVNLRGTDRAPLSDHYGVRSQIQWADRYAALYDPADTIVRERKAAAVAALNRAKKVLAAEKKPVFDSAIAQVDGLLQKFQNGLPDAAETIFRTP